jgi:molybdate transport system substrate-binding protein
VGRAISFSDLAASVLWLLLLLAALFACAPSSEEGDASAELPPISVAASTARMMQELCELYAKDSGVRFRIDAGSSSTLARQIEHGKGYSLFVAAHPKWVDYLLERGVGDADSRQDWLRNELVWIRHREAEFVLVQEGERLQLPASWSGLLSVGDPSHVPVGIYAEQALRHVGLWARFSPQSQDEVAPRLVPAANASAALRNVSSGQCDTGIVYSSDAMQSEEVVVVHRFAAKSHERILYPLMLPKGASDVQRAFASWLLRSPEVAAVLSRHGFAPAGR